MFCFNVLEQPWTKNNFQKLFDSKCSNKQIPKTSNRSFWNKVSQCSNELQSARASTTMLEWAGWSSLVFFVSLLRSGLVYTLVYALSLWICLICSKYSTPFVYMVKFVGAFLCFEASGLVISHGPNPAFCFFFIYLCYAKLKR